MNAALWLAVAMLGTAPGPLHLVTEQVGESIRITVVGTSKVACHANYVLEVSTVMEGGRNRAVQRGTARMEPGAKTEVATTSLANAGNWSARLSVDSCGMGKRYEETAGPAAVPTHSSIAQP